MSPRQPSLGCMRRKPRGGREAEERRPGDLRSSMREGVRAVLNGDGWPWVPAQASEAAGSGVPALPIPQRLVTSHPPPPQDAAGPPGPLCASSAARLRLTGSPVRQDPRRAESPEPSGIVVTTTRSPEARSARPCPRASLRTHPYQDQRTSGGVSADRGVAATAQSVLERVAGSFCFLQCWTRSCFLLTDWLDAVIREVERATEA